MTTKWQVLDLTGTTCRVRYERGSLLITHEGRELGHAVLATLAVVLLGSKSTISTGALSVCAQRDISVLLCDWRGVPTGGLYGWNETSRVGARHRAQATLTLPRQKNAWGRLVKAKIAGQAHTLGLLKQPGTPYLSRLASEDKSGDPKNAEAQAARFYWKKLFGNRDFSRIPGSDEAVNALLNYGYTVLRGHGIRAVLSAGLSPTLGIFHRGRANPFSLVDDLIEPFRPVVDFVVGELVDANELDISPHVRKTLVEASRLGFGHNFRVTTEFSRLAQSFARYVEGEIDRLPVPTWSGPDEADDDE